MTSSPLAVQTKEHQDVLLREKESFEKEKSALMAQLPPGHLTVPQTRQSPSPGDSLESSMLKAAEESKLLKSVVVPLEEVGSQELSAHILLCCNCDLWLHLFVLCSHSSLLPCQQEIDLLKVKLAEAEERLRLYESNQKATSPPLIDLDTPLPPETCATLSPSPTDMGKVWQLAWSGSSITVHVYFHSSYSCNTNWSWNALLDMTWRCIQKS